MKFGFFMMPLHAPGENPTLAFERDLELIEYAERLGFDEFWIGEHHSAGWETIPAPDLMIAAAASRTKRIRLGTAVINLPYHHPFHVAERMAFLDHLTYGRVMMGVGPGALPPDVKLFGLDPSELRPMMNESLEIILKLYEEDEPVTYEGRYWQIREMMIQVKPYQRPYMPIAVASTGGRNSLTLAGKYGLMLLSAGGGEGLPMIEGSVGISEQWSVVEESARAHSRSVDRANWRIARQVYVAETMDDALRDVIAGTKRDMHYGLGLGARALYEEYPGQPIDEIPIERIVQRRRPLAGDPEYVINGIRSLQEASGGFGGLLLIASDWPAREKYYKSLEMFARYVMPVFKDSATSVIRAWEQSKRDAAEGRLPQTMRRVAPQSTSAQSHQSQ